jgi:hypothetical protein
MIGNTLTLENLTAIYNAMSLIKEIDRSDYFNQYWKELECRINEIEPLENIRKKLMI